MSKRVSLKLRRLVATRAKGLCEYCRTPERFSTDGFSVEHVTPRQAGGTSVAANLALSCQECNNHKYTKTHALDPVTSASVPLFHPREHDWHAHFTWNEDFTLLIGISPSGRATIEALRLNRQGVVNLRRVLFAMNEHPQSEENEAIS